MNHSNIGAFLGRLTQTSLACTWTPGLPTSFHSGSVLSDWTYLYIGAPKWTSSPVDRPVDHCNTWKYYPGPTNAFNNLSVLARQCISESIAKNQTIEQNIALFWFWHSCLRKRTCAKHVYIWLVKAWKTNPLIRYIHFPLPIWAG